MILTLAKIDELSELMGFDFTQQGMQECMDRHGIGCKWCEVPATEMGWYYHNGDIYCFTCAYTLDNMNEAEGGAAESELLPTREQLAQRREYDRAGIGID